MISDEQLLRYNRQIMVPGFDVAGQERLLAATVLIVGLGGLGCPAALYLAAAGVGELLLADGDPVELSNLQRQIAHGEADLGANKAQSAAAAIARINSAARITPIPQRLDEAALRRHAARADLVVDATDSFQSRLDINRACLAARTPWVSGAAIRSEGQVAVFDPAAPTACYRCLYPEDSAPPESSCAETGILAPIVGIIGALQALEALKLLADSPRPRSSALLILDGATLNTRTLRLQPNPACPCCGPGTPAERAAESHP